MRRRRLIWLPILLALTALHAVGQDRLTKLAPEPILVQLENGSGSANLIFVRKASTAAPDFKITEAIGATNTIPEKDITFEWLSAPAESAERDILTARLIVRTQAFVEPGVSYKGKIILRWPDAESVFDYAVQDNNSISFNLSPEKFDIALGPWQPDNVKLRVKNTGKGRITDLLVSSPDLLDAVTHHRMTLQGLNLSDLNINPGEEKEITFQLPNVILAGTYSGNLDVVANRVSRKTMALVLRTRGPNYFKGLPFILFALTLALGFYLSSLMEGWFALGGLQQAQTLVSLRESQADITQSLSDIQKLEDDNAVVRLPRAKLWLQLAQDELSGIIKAAAETPQDKLTASAQRFALIAATASILLSAVRVAVKQWQGDQTKQGLVITALDNVAVPADSDALNTYQNNLLNVLQGGIASVAGGSTPESIPSFAKATPDLSLKQLKSRITFMTRLYRVLIWVVVFFLAYMTLYLNNLSFGTFLDYIGVFLWALGLTQTGTQIISKAHSSYSRPA